MRSVVVSTCLVLGLMTLSVHAQEGPVSNCKVMPNRADAGDFPSKHAWDLFVALNHPAVNEMIERGQPDCSRPIGSPGATSVWETWRNAETEVYLQDGAEPPEWNDNMLPDAPPGSIPKLVASPLEATLSPGPEQRFLMSFHDFASDTVRPKFSPGDGVFTGSGGFGETRMNRATYEFIKRNCLWSKEGQQRYAKAVQDGKKAPLSFPVDSIEVKAAWLDFTAAGIPEANQKRYYTAEYKGKKYGLTSLHILTKDIPNWFWATFHHVDAPKNEFETPDHYGRPKELNGTVWENYVLGGTQTDFVTPTGRPTILSDHYVEFGFQRSSCITCHATATMSPDGSPGPSQPMALCLLSPDVVEKLMEEQDVCTKLVDTRLFEPGTDKLLFERGVPLPEWYVKDGKPFHFQTDFVWSIPFRAANEKSQPPSRCIW